MLPALLLMMVYLRLMRDGPVGAGVGAQLGELEDASFETGFSANVNFNIVDDANDITAALSGDTTGAMDNAASLIASGGTATVAEALRFRV